ncbi:hypothetical protein ENBRE01_2769 [Enteropsectra breve]|nr:hypothetical protein ENBRE01_2769 [Enteropsectra breve]
MFTRRNFARFSNYVEFFQNHAFICVKKDIVNWQDVVCSCKIFLKKKRCVHVFSYLKLSKKDNIVSEVLIKPKAKRGRKKKIKKGNALGFN